MDFLLNNSVRCLKIYTGIVCRCYAHQRGNAMRKVMGGGSKKQFKYSETPILSNATNITKGANEGKKSGNSRRVTVLNKTFMKYITDLMATGEYANEIVGHGIEVNKVKVTPDYKLLKIYWIARGTADDQEVEKILSKNAGFLRNELSQLRVMGVVPKLEFVKDKQYAQIVELDNRLAIADFGEDYVPAEPFVKLKTQLELYTPLDDDIKLKLSKLEEETVEEEIYEEPLPPMTQNTLGLNHADILQRIQKLMKKSEAVHRLHGEDGETVVEGAKENEDPVLYNKGDNERLTLKQFLKKREIQRFKTRREDKNYRPDFEYIQQEYMENREKFLKNLDLPYDEDEDFLLDDDKIEK